MKRAIALVALLLLAVLGARLAFLTLQIGRQSTRNEAQAADVIVVLGAAEYRGRPSPVLKARLDHALGLYRRNLAPRILTTGGAGGDPDYTEGGVGRSYLIERNVPSEAIIVEVESVSTAETAAATAEIMRRMGLKSCIVVSDGYHIFRVKRMLELRGFTVYGAPRPSSAPGGGGQWWLYFRQSVGYLLWSWGLAA